MAWRRKGDSGCIKGIPIVIGLLLQVLAMGAGAQTFEAPAAVQANPDGSFEYDATFTAGAEGAVLATAEVVGENTDFPPIIIDYFCMRDLAPGEEEVIRVSGYIIDKKEEGKVTVDLFTCAPEDSLFQVETIIVPVDTIVTSRGIIVPVEITFCMEFPWCGIMFLEPDAGYEGYFLYSSDIYMVIELQSNVGRHVEARGSLHPCVEPGCVAIDVATLAAITWCCLDDGTGHCHLMLVNECQEKGWPVDACLGDNDNDGVDDACEEDSDNDGVFDHEDNCPDLYNPDQVDMDHDGFGDLCDNCPAECNPSQTDTDNDGIGDACGCGTRCDDNFDGVINVLDVIGEIICILDPAACLADSCRFWRADCNCDSVVNILDVIMKVNCILGIFDPCPPPCTCTPVVKSPSGPARIYTPEIEVPTREKGKGMKPKGETGFRLPIYLDSEDEVGGLQLKLSYDPAALTPGEPKLAKRSVQMTLASNAEDGELIIVIYSETGEAIASGSGAILTIPFKTQDSRPKTHDTYLQFLEVILAGSGCQAIPVEIEPIVMKTVPLPTEFALEQNYPNPFNPFTDVRYQIPDVRCPVHTTLKIYNILGQEVRTLVDEVQGNGYYTVTWDGKDALGNDVASGIYFYRLTAGPFTATKRMILLK